MSGRKRAAVDWLRIPGKPRMKDPRRWSSLGRLEPVFERDGPTFFELVRQALASTERGYDMLAPKFDKTPFRTPTPVLTALATVIGGERSIGSALDVCCGTGAALEHLRPLCRDRVVGLDFSRGMLDEARRHAGSWPGTADVSFVRGDALAMPFQDEFDVVTSVGAFGHVLPKDEERFVAGIRRALKPGGRFVFATSEMPKPTSRAWWIARSFNAVMHLRNAVLRPEFIMFYLTFVWPDVRELLERHGFRVTAQRKVCAPPYDGVVIVVGTRT